MNTQFSPYTYRFILYATTPQMSYLKQLHNLRTKVFFGVLCVFSNVTRTYKLEKGLKQIILKL